MDFFTPEGTRDALGRNPRLDGAEILRAVPRRDLRARTGARDLRAELRAALAAAGTTG